MAKKGAKKGGPQFVTYNSSRGFSPESLSTSFGGNFVEVKGRNFTGYQREGGVGPVYKKADSGH